MKILVSKMVTLGIKNKFDQDIYSPYSQSVPNRALFEHEQTCHFGSDDEWYTRTQSYVWLQGLFKLLQVGVKGTGDPSLSKTNFPSSLISFTPSHQVDQLNLLLPSAAIFMLSSKFLGSYILPLLLNVLHYWLKHSYLQSCQSTVIP